MVDTFTVAFFGHRHVENIGDVMNLLGNQVREIVDEKEHVSFLVGRHGDFDRCAAAAVYRMRKEYRDDNNSLVLVLPYPTAAYTNHKEAFHAYFTDVEISLAASSAHPKAAIPIRNHEMVDRADLIICYVGRESGGAWQAIQYAKKQGKKIINIYGL
jgi:hypothetical protein